MAYQTCKLTKKEVHQVVNTLNEDGVFLARYSYDPFFHGWEWVPISPTDQITDLSGAIAKIG